MSPFSATLLPPRSARPIRQSAPLAWPAPSRPHLERHRHRAAVRVHHRQPVRAASAMSRRHSASPSPLHQLAIQQPIAAFRLCAPDAQFHRCAVGARRAAKHRACRARPALQLRQASGGCAVGRAHCSCASQPSRSSGTRPAAPPARTMGCRGRARRSARGRRAPGDDLAPTHPPAGLAGGRNGLVERQARAPLPAILWGIAGRLPGQTANTPRPAHANGGGVACARAARARLPRAAATAGGGVGAEVAWVGVPSGRPPRQRCSGR